MIFSRDRHYDLRSAAWALLLLVASPVHSAPGFITSATITRDADSALITIQFACRVEYIDHLPILYGDRL